MTKAKLIFITFSLMLGAFSASASDYSETIDSSVAAATAVIDELGWNSTINGEVVIYNTASSTKQFNAFNGNDVICSGSLYKTAQTKASKNIGAGKAAAIAANASGGYIQVSEGKLGKKKCQQLKQKRCYMYKTDNTFPEVPCKE